MHLDRDRIVFFDLDGCVLDSSRAIPRAINRALAQVGLPSVAASEIHALIGPPLELFAVQLVRRVGGSDEAAGLFARAYLKRYEESMTSESTVYDGIPRALAETREGSRLAIVTLKRQALAEQLLLHFDLMKHFDFVVGATGSETGKEPLLLRAIRQAQASHGVIVGDQRADMVAARHAGIPGIGVTWGFGSVADLRAGGAAAIVRAPGELPRAIGETWKSRDQSFRAGI